MMRLIYLAYRVYCFFARPVTLGVRVMLIQNDQALLVRHTYIEGWFMPGGGVKRGETLEQAARREVREEAGAELQTLAILGAYSNFAWWKSDHNIVFVSDQFTASRKHDGEIAEARFFPLDALPESVWPGHRRKLEEYRAQNGQPQFGEW
ncbi:MAG: NUDIX domain-containing protein [Chloroflexi bacterium]|nr:NUDIX domain-containing protein [Chloroflexota bacterium]MBI2757576.1 NUDIX domain-containing protein [Chloroflexota bacterium]